MNRVEEAQARFVEALEDSGVDYTRTSITNDAVVWEHFGDRVAQLGREYRASLRISDCYTGREPSMRTVIDTICDALDSIDVPGASIIREAAMESLRGEQ